MGDILSSLNFNLNAFLVNIAGFLLLLWVLNRLLFKPVGGLLAQRQHEIAATYDKLEADRNQMETLRADYEQRLAGIEAEAREKIQNAIKDAQGARDQIVQEAQTRSREMITRAEAEVAREREQALITLRQQVVDLALNAATKVIGDGLDEARQRRLIDEFITTNATATAVMGTAAATQTPTKNGAQAYGDA